MPPVCPTALLVMATSSHLVTQPSHKARRDASTFPGVYRKSKYSVFHEKSQYRMSMPAAAAPGPSLHYPHKQQMNRVPPGHWAAVHLCSPSTPESTFPRITAMGPVRAPGWGRHLFLCMFLRAQKSISSFRCKGWFPGWSWTYLEFVQKYQQGNKVFSSWAKCACEHVCAYVRARVCVRICVHVRECVHTRKQRP